MNLKAVFEQLQGKRVVVIGDIILDTYIWGDVKRISPEAPVPVFETTTEKTGCGGAANVAQNVASLGGNAILVGVIGEDREGEKLVRMLTEIDLVTIGVYTDTQRPTSTKTRVIARATATFADQEQNSGHHLLRIDRESKQDISPQIREYLLDTVVSQLPTSDAIIFADYDKGVVTAQLIKGVIKHAKSYGIPIIVDPKQNNFWHYEGVTAVTPNHKEASAAVHEEVMDVSDLVAVGEKILNRLSLKALLITRDANGMSLFQRNADRTVEVEHLPPNSNIVTDVTGAGDTVVAAFTLALAADAGFRSAAMLSNLAGGIAVGKMGCATVTPKELLSTIETAARKN
ncbi:D-glycero-beta-D-manno-heptose-7-phosphate kinase [Candidatus Poribacteria bacterium]|nr:MAG: D-glycero-beta-D-manno-heptose-7-phosphate kinase [Candidatus Poribacteria bacterium]